MGDNQKAPRGHFSLDEILAEARTLETTKQEPAPTEDKAKAETGRQKALVTPEEIAARAKSALDAKTASIPARPAPEKKKGRRKGLFGRRKREIPELYEEEDIYYGLQLKPLEDYRDDYEKTIQPNINKAKKEESNSIFSYLFSETGDDTVDDEIAERFERLHSERKKRVEKIMHQVGLEQDDIFSLYDKRQDEPAQPHAPSTIPSEPKPVPRVEPEPEIEPGPVQKPEIQEPGPEPVFQPSPPPMTPPSPLTPDVVPTIRSRFSDEPAKEPVPVPQVKEQIPPAPAVTEPEKPVPQSTGRPVYRASSGRPVHMILFDDMKDVFGSVAESYPPAKPKQPPPPIPIPLQESAGADGKEQLFGQDGESPSAPEQAEKPTASEESNPISEAAEPIPFPEPAVSLTMESENGENEENPFAAGETETAVKKKHFNLFGNEEEDNDTGDTPPGEEEELDDYISPGDAPSIFHELGANIRKLYLRLAVTGISLVLLLIFGILRVESALLPQVIQVWLNTQTYLILNLVFLLIATAFSFTPVLNGIKGLFVFQANADSAVAVAGIAAIIQNIALLFSLQSVRSGSLHLYSVLAVMALFFNTAGKLSMAKRINRNFHYVAAPGQKQAVQLFDDHNTALQMASGCVIDAPVIAFQTKTNFLKHFLSLSYEPDPSEQSSQTLAPIGFVSSLILCIITVILLKDVFSALTVFAASACICVPFVNMLSVNLPVNRISWIAARCGGMVAGYSAIEHFSGVNAVLVDAKELFPKGTVVLNAIKTFGGQRIDDAIVDATALMCAAGGPLSDLFDQIIKSRRDMLPKIDNPVYEDDKGVTGWVSGRRIFVGNRELMKAHSIEPPSRDYEEKYIRSGKKIVYLASGGDLVAMFVVTYNSDRRRAMELRRMEDNGISLIVRTCDPNITPRFLGECFGLDVHSVRVLPERLGSIYTAMTSVPQERSPALMATKGRPTAMMRLLTACVRQRSNISIAVALQNVAVILGFLMVAFFTCYSGLQQLSTTALMIYEVFWAAAVLVVPKLRKP